MALYGGRRDRTDIKRVLGAGREGLGLQLRCVVLYGGRGVKLKDTEGKLGQELEALKGFWGQAGRIWGRSCDAWRFMGTVAAKLKGTEEKPGSAGVGDEALEGVDEEMVAQRKNVGCEL